MTLFPTLGLLGLLRVIQTTGDCTADAGLSMLQIMQGKSSATLAKVHMQHETSSTDMEAERDAGHDENEGLTPNVTVVISRTTEEKLDWLPLIDLLPHVLETEYSFRGKPVPAPEHPDLVPGIEFQKPMTLNGATTYECGGFLDFIVRRYDQLPRISAFVHGRPLGEHRHKHGDPYIFSALRQMALAPGKVGYCSLNGESAWKTWPEERRGGNGDRWEEAVKSMKTDPLRFGHLISVFAPFRHDTGMKVYDSAQFAVSRERVRRHPVAFYAELLDWVRNDSTVIEDDNAKRCALLEIFWHRIFGEAPALPHPQGRCAALYGLDLK